MVVGDDSCRELEPSEANYLVWSIFTFIFYKKVYEAYEQRDQIMEYKSSPIFPNIAQKVVKSFWTWR